MTRLFLLLLITMTSSIASADWTLDEQASKLYFLSTKNLSKTEVHTFKTITGSFTDAGQANIFIDLSSVETNIPVRNERMQKLLFEVANFPKAEISLTVDSNKLSALTPGAATVVRVEANLSLHGIRKPVIANLLVTGLQKGGLMAATQAPILLSLEDFGLVDGIEKLRTLAKLDSIDLKVPVTFTLVFDKK